MLTRPGMPMSLAPDLVPGDTTAGLMLASHPHWPSNSAMMAWPETNGCSIIPVPWVEPSAFHRSCVNTLISTIP